MRCEYCLDQLVWSFFFFTLRKLTQLRIQGNPFHLMSKTFLNIAYLYKTFLRPVSITFPKQIRSSPPRMLLKISLQHDFIWFFIYLGKTGALLSLIELLPESLFTTRIWRLLTSFCDHTQFNFCLGCMY